MKLKTRVFELCDRKYANLVELSQTTGIPASQVYRVRNGKRPINEKFIIGAIKAFPGYGLDDLFYVARNGSENDYRMKTKTGEIWECSQYAYSISQR